VPACKRVSVFVHVSRARAASPSACASRYAPPAPRSSLAYPPTPRIVVCIAAGCGAGVQQERGLARQNQAKGRWQQQGINTPGAGRRQPVYAFGPWFFAANKRAGQPWSSGYSCNACIENASGHKLPLAVVPYFQAQGPSLDKLRGSRRLPVSAAIAHTGLIYSFSLYQLRRCRAAASTTRGLDRADGSLRWFCFPYLSFLLSAWFLSITC